jgi:tetratricopeptide (TPR) repeat protein
LCGKTTDIKQPSSFSDNPSLQNLLMLTAAKSDRGRMMDYIHQLEHYTPEDIAQQCIEVGMYEEAFEIYKKHGQHHDAANVLIEHIVSIDRAHEYAERVETPEVWSRVAKAQLDGLRVTDSIDSYIRAGDPSNFLEVIEIATHAGKDEDLIKFLRMARKTLREVPVDTALAFCFARTNQLPELEEFLRGTNVADVEASGDKAYEEGYHEAAKIFFTSISNWAKLATTLVHLEDYQAAVECARKANSVKVWRQVNMTCIDNKEFRLAQICGLNLIIHAEELADLVKQYERHGYFDELISLLEAGLGLGEYIFSSSLMFLHCTFLRLDIRISMTPFWPMGKVRPYSRDTGISDVYSCLPSMAGALAQHSASRRLDTSLTSLASQLRVWFSTHRVTRCLRIVLFRTFGTTRSLRTRTLTSSSWTSSNIIYSEHLLTRYSH